MDRLIVDNNEFIVENFCDAVCVFSTAKNNLSFYSKSQEGKANLENIKNWFDVNDVGFLSQIHSDIIHIYDGEIKSGDALITDKKKIAIGVFTADCVPVLIYDPVKKAAAAVHSGWKGTLNRIVEKTIKKMTGQFETEPSSLKVAIGPHIRDCCYEIGNEVSEKFMSDDLYAKADIFEGNHLSMEKAIMLQLEKCGVNKENIHTEGGCTFCDKSRFYSYRRGDIEKRQFSFIYIK